MKNKLFKSDITRNLSYNFFAYLFFVGFGVMAIWDASARILIVDPAYYLFNMINESGFYVPGPRLTAIINQLLVVFSIKLNVPLKYLIPIYSVSFVLLRLFYFFLVNTVFKNRTAGMAIIAISILGVAESYFRPTSESTIAMLNSILLYAFLFFVHQKNWRSWKIIVQLAGTFILVLFGYFTHPIAVFSLLFVIIYYSLATRSLKTLYPYFAVGFTVVLFMWKVFVDDTSEHHQSLYGNLIASPFLIIKELEGYHPYKFFEIFYSRLYRPVFILFVVGSIVLFFQKSKRLTALFIMLFIPTYFVIVCASFKDGDANMQMEKIFLPLVMYSTVAFSDGISFFLKDKKIIHLIMIFLFVFIGFRNINSVRPIYHGRIDYLKEIIAEADNEKNRKLIIESEQLDRKIVFTWAMGIETLMLSTIDDRMKPLTIYCIQGKENLKGKKDNPGNFIATHFRTSYQQTRFNKNYFKLSVQNYEKWPVDLK